MVGLGLTLGEGKRKDEKAPDSRAECDLLTLGFLVPSAPQAPRVTSDIPSRSQLQ